MVMQFGQHLGCLMVPLKVFQLVVQLAMGLEGYLGYPKVLL